MAVSVNSLIYIHIYVNSPIYIHIYVNSLTYIHKYVSSHIYIHIYVNSLIYIHIYVISLKHSQICKFTYIHSHMCKSTFIIHCVPYLLCMGDILSRIYLYTAMSLCHGQLVSIVPGHFKTLVILKQPNNSAGHFKTSFGFEMAKSY